MKHKLSCIIIDDEPLARKGLTEYVEEVPFLQLAGNYENAIKASVYLQSNQVDLMFLDIQMPKQSGIEFLKSLQNPPLVIFTTAFSEYALESYTLDVIDYLLKPIPFNRFLQASQKAFDFYQLHQKANADIPRSFFFVKCDHKYEKVNYADILYLEAMQNYCVIHTPDRKLIAYLTISGLESQLPKSKFIRVHKSFIVSIDKISALDSHEICVGKARIPISRSMKNDVMDAIMGSNLLSR